jgi:Na+-driven multidrug efflux pump
MGRLSLSYCLALTLCLSLLILLFGSRFVSIFSSDPEVHAIALQVVPNLSLFLLFDGMQGK